MYGLEVGEARHPVWLFGLRDRSGTGRSFPAKLRRDCDCARNFEASGLKLDIWQGEPSSIEEAAYTQRTLSLERPQAPGVDVEQSADTQDQSHDKYGTQRKGWQMTNTVTVVVQGEYTNRKLV